MNPLAIFTRRFRGFRVIDIAAVLVILVTALASYAFKTSAGAEDADANSIESQILSEQKRIRLLNAEIARLDDPKRIETLSTQYLGMAAATGKQEIAATDLARIAAHAAAAAPARPTPVASPAPAGSGPPVQAKVPVKP
jgi:cell division protein FtsL